MNKEKTRSFRSRYPSCRYAIADVQKKLGCSQSKAEKITWGTYKCKPQPLELRAIARLFKCKPEEIFV